MDYYFDTEFLEGPQDKRFLGIKTGSKTKNTIDLISIGIVSKDGREYYAISKDFNLKEAWNRYDLVVNKRYPKGPEYIKNYWIRENVLKPIFIELSIKETGAKGEKAIESGNRLFGQMWKDFPNKNYSELKRLIKKYGKSNKEISEEVKTFCNATIWVKDIKGNMTLGTDGPNKRERGYFKWDEPRFYAYYADYDWVVFCWLFGKMIDLPKGFPMYCTDLKQELDYIVEWDFENMTIQENFWKLDFEDRISFIEVHPKFPKNENEHNALSDARWALKLHKFIQSL